MKSLKNLLIKPLLEIGIFLGGLLLPQDEKVEKLSRMEDYKLREFLPKAEKVPDKLSSPIFNYRNKNVRTCIWAIKYKAHRVMIRKMSGFLYEEVLCLAEEELLMQGKKKVALVPIPASKRRVRKYGFNQCRLLCEEVVKINKEIKIFDILEKVRESDHQTRLSRTERIKNMKESIGLRRGYAGQVSVNIKDYLLIIIDDVYTTGATIKEARRALAEAGFKNTFAVTLAH